MDASTGSQLAAAELRHIEESFAAVFVGLAGPVGRSVLFGLRVDRLDHLASEVERDAALDALGRMIAARPESTTWLVERIAATCWVLVPGADAKQGLPLARELVQAGRALAFESGGKVRRLSISCGMAHSAHPSRPSLAACAAVVDEGLRVASASGGRRAVHSEVYSAFASSPGTSAGAAGAASHFAAPALSGQQTLRQVELPRAPTSSAPAAPVPAAALANGRQPLRKSQVALPAVQGTAPVNEESGEVLHRRLTKLSRELEMAEAEIARLRAQVAREGEGLASIYREVQGLSEDAASAGLKREMMARLFEANMALRALAAEGERAKLPA